MTLIQYAEDLLDRQWLCFPLLSQIVTFLYYDDHVAMSSPLERLYQFMFLHDRQTLRSDLRIETSSST